MAVVYDLMRRLEAEPRLEDLARGFKAETADPVWFLGRHWQLGEHLGEDASSPVRVEYRPSLVPVDPLGGDPRMDPRTTAATSTGTRWTRPARCRCRRDRRRRYLS